MSPDSLLAGQVEGGCGGVFDECGRNGGQPLTGKALEQFLPWNASPADRRAWAQPPPPG